MRSCPTAAVRVRKRKAVKLKKRCIDCGECKRACRKGAIVSLTDPIECLSRFKRLVAIPSPALYAQFDEEVLPGVISAALKKCGFHHVECASRACDEVTAATEIFVKEHRGRFPLISSFCPAVVRLVQLNYPGLLDQMLPILPPAELAARDAKTSQSARTGLSVERIGAIHLTPCPAVMFSIQDHPGIGRSYLDAAVAISDIFQTLAEGVAEVGEVEENMDGGETASGVSWAFMAGLPRSLPADHAVSAAGIQSVIRILDDVEKGKLKDCVLIECYACAEGCVGGCLTVENPDLARSKAIKLTQQLPAGPAAGRDDLERRYRRGEFFTDEPLFPLEKDSTESAGMVRERDLLLSRLPGIDCGVCGAPSCRAFAEDSVLGSGSGNSCSFIRHWTENR
jgi:Fe-S-cluster-containing hydrogenase component 2